MPRRAALVLAVLMLAFGASSARWLHMAVAHGGGAAHTACGGHSCATHAIDSASKHDDRPAPRSPSHDCDTCDQLATIGHAVAPASIVVVEHSRVGEAATSAPEGRAFRARLDSIRARPPPAA